MIVDSSVLERWRADDLVAPLVEMFAEDAPRLAREIAVSAPPARYRLAHTLRGCALNLGAQDLATAAAAIEQGESAPIASLEALAAETVRALRGHCSAKQCAPLAFTDTK